MTRIISKMSWEVSFADMCRVCMKVDGRLLDMYDDNIKNYRLSDKLAELTSVKVSISLTYTIDTSCYDSFECLIFTIFHLKLTNCFYGFFFGHIFASLWREKMSCFSTIITIQLLVTHCCKQ